MFIMFASALAILSFLPAALAVPVSIADVISNTWSLAARDGFGSVTSATGLNFYNPDFWSGTAGYGYPETYNCFSGPASNFPDVSQWMNFDAMFNLNQQQSLVPVGDNGPEQGAIYNTIVSISQASLVDPRVILAFIIQESTGNVRVGCTNNGVTNCGLMQSYDSQNSYDPNNMQDSITAMVRDGTQGTAAGPGLVQFFNDAGDTGTTTGGNVYAVARAYNSGQIDANNLSDPMGATASYVSDIANRLLGWDGNGAGSSYCGF